MTTTEEMDDGHFHEEIRQKVKQEESELRGDSWKDEIRHKLILIFEGKDVEIFARVLWYLDEELRSYEVDEAGSGIPPGWKALKSTLDSDELFTWLAERLAEDTKEPGRDAEFHKAMNTFYVNTDTIGNKCDPEPSPEDLESFVIVPYTPDFAESKASGFFSLSRVWSLLLESTQNRIIHAIPSVMINRHFVYAIDEGIALVNRTGVRTIMVGLAGISLSYEAIKNLYRWWHGGITGKRFVKNMVDNTCTVGAGLAGGMAGAAGMTALGSLGGPAGIVAGGIIAGIISSSVMSVLCDRMTQALFGVPKDEALEKAYNHIGVHKDSTNIEINAAYRKLCLKHHPDKGGEAEDFVSLQVHMGVIKLARGELL